MTMTNSRLVMVLALAAGWMAPGHAAVLSNPIADGAITVDANRSDWAGITRYADDTAEGYPIDLGFVTMAHDSTNLYVRYQMYSPSSPFSGSYQLLLDTDQNVATGYNGQNSVYLNNMGADRFIQGASVFSHAGATQDAFAFNFLGGVTFNNTGAASEDVEWVVPLAMLGNPTQFNFLMWIDSNTNFGIDSEAIGGDDHFPNGAFLGAAGTTHTYLIPEPASLAFLGCGILIVLAKRRNA